MVDGGRGADEDEGAGRQALSQPQIEGGWVQGAQDVGPKGPVGAKVKPKTGHQESHRPTINRVPRP